MSLVLYCGELARLMLGGQRIDQLIERFALEHQIELCSVRPMR